MTDGFLSTVLYCEDIGREPNIKRVELDLSLAVTNTRDSYTLTSLLKALFQQGDMNTANSISNPT